MRMAQQEGDAEIGAGQLAIDPVFDGEPVAAEASEEEGPNVAFGRFVNLMRRQRRVSLEQLADDADVDMADLVEIESDPHHKPELRTAYQLANYFKVSRSGLMQVAGLAGPKDARLFDEGVRFAARSEPNCGADARRACGAGSVRGRAQRANVADRSEDLAKNRVLSDKTAKDIDERVQRILRGLKSFEPSIEMIRALRTKFGNTLSDNVVQSHRVHRWRPAISRG